jgi:hypothetical protein
MTLQESWHGPRNKRCAIIQPEGSRIGDLWFRQGAAAGLEVRDPTFVFVCQKQAEQLSR